MRGDRRREMLVRGVTGPVHDRVAPVTTVHDRFTSEEDAQS